MPLDTSGSKASIGRNIRTEQAHGKPHKQAVAISLDVARRHGGNVPARHGAAVSAPGGANTFAPGGLGKRRLPNKVRTDAPDDYEARYGSHCCQSREYYNVTRLAASADTDDDTGQAQNPPAEPGLLHEPSPEESAHIKRGLDRHVNKTLAKTGSHIGADNSLGRHYHEGRSSYAASEDLYDVKYGSFTPRSRYDAGDGTLIDTAQGLGGGGDFGGSTSSRGSESGLGNGFSPFEDLRSGQGGAGTFGKESSEGQSSEGQSSDKQGPMPGYLRDQGQGASQPMGNSSGSAYTPRSAGDILGLRGVSPRGGPAGGYNVNPVPALVSGSVISPSSDPGARSAARQGFSQWRDYTQSHGRGNQTPVNMGGTSYEARYASAAGSSAARGRAVTSQFTAHDTTGAIRG